MSIITYEELTNAIIEAELAAGCLDERYKTMRELCDEWSISRYAAVTSLRKIREIGGKVLVGSKKVRTSTRTQRVPAYLVELPRKPAGRSARKAKKPRRRAA